MTDLYLVWSVQHSGWWGPERCGYVRSLARAGRYTHEEALEICTRAIPGRLGVLPELPVPLGDVEAMVAAYDLEFPSRPEPWR